MSRHEKSRPITGFTLVEILLVLGLIAILAAIALPAYQDYVYRTEVARAVTDIAAISVKIKQYELDERALPDSLADVREAATLDPWGQPYRYTNLRLKGSTGKARKDKHLNPLNSDFDLYSIGRDHQTVSPLPPRVSHDDVIRANDGLFIGLAKDF